MRTFLPLLCTALVLALMAGCASKPKSSTRIYEGDAPSIKYGEEESAGGALRGR